MRRARGYTVIEVLMSLSVLAIGLSGIIAMQKVTVSSSAYSKNLATATRIAEAWLEQLVADGARWTLAANLGPNTTWLQLITTVPGQWVRPEDWDEPRQFGPGFDALGRPVEVLDNARFCTDLRLVWLRETPPGPPGSGLIRAEVRVFWFREGVAADDVEPSPCAVDPLPEGTDPQAYDRFHWVYAATAVAQQPVD